MVFVSSSWNMNLPQFINLSECEAILFDTSRFEPDESGIQFKIVGEDVIIFEMRSGKEYRWDYMPRHDSDDDFAYRELCLETDLKKIRQLLTPSPTPDNP